RGACLGTGPGAGAACSPSDARRSGARPEGDRPGMADEGARSEARLAAGPGRRPRRPLVPGLAPEVRALDLDGSVMGQARRGAALGARLRAVALRSLGPEIRYLATRGAMRRLAAALAPAARGCLTFTGSGDFHHVTAALLRRFAEPLS